MSGAAITIVCLIKAKETTKHVVEKELRGLAAKARTESGNINYDLHVSVADDGLFIIYENWKDQVALDTHMDQPHLKQFLENADSLLERPIDGKLCRKL